jgi:flagellar hook-associated protein FlgK
MYQHLTGQPTNTAERDQLIDLAEAMQRQLNMLTRAVDELKDVSAWGGVIRCGCDGAMQKKAQ